MKREGRNVETLSIVVAPAERRWLVERAAEAAVRTGERQSISGVVRELIEEKLRGTAA
jgi:hypothetical protein